MYEQCRNFEMEKTTLETPVDDLRIASLSVETSFL